MRQHLPVILLVVGGCSGLAPVGEHRSAIEGEPGTTDVVDRRNIVEARVPTFEVSTSTCVDLDSTVACSCFTQDSSTKLYSFDPNHECPGVGRCLDRDRDPTAVGCSCFVPVPGTDPPQYTWRKRACFNVYNLRCTGTLIGRSTVLTAGHCEGLNYVNVFENGFNPDGSGRPQKSPRQYRIIARSSPAHYAGGAGTVEDFSMPNSIGPGPRFATDLELLYVDRPVRGAVDAGGNLIAALDIAPVDLPAGDGLGGTSDFGTCFTSLAHDVRCTRDIDKWAANHADNPVFDIWGWGSNAPFTAKTVVSGALDPDGNPVRRSNIYSSDNALLRHNEFASYAGQYVNYDDPTLPFDDPYDQRLGFVMTPGDGMPAFCGGDSGGPMLHHNPATAADELVGIATSGWGTHDTDGCRCACACADASCSHRLDDGKGGCLKDASGQQQFDVDANGYCRVFHSDLRAGLGTRLQPFADWIESHRYAAPLQVTAVTSAQLEGGLPVTVSSGAPPAVVNFYAVVDARTFQSQPDICHDGTVATAGRYYRDDRSCPNPLTIDLNQSSDPRIQVLPLITTTNPNTFWSGALNCPCASPTCDNCGSWSIGPLAVPVDFDATVGGRRIAGMNADNSGAFFRSGTAPPTWNVASPPDSGNTAPTGEQYTDVVNGPGYYACSSNVCLCNGMPCSPARSCGIPSDCSKAQLNPYGNLEQAHGSLLVGFAPPSTSTYIRATQPFTMKIGYRDNRGAHMIRVRFSSFLSGINQRIYFLIPMRRTANDTCLPDDPGCEGAQVDAYRAEQSAGENPKCQDADGPGNGIPNGTERYCLRPIARRNANVDPSTGVLSADGKSKSAPATLFDLERNAIAVADDDAPRSSVHDPIDTDSTHPTVYPLIGPSEPIVGADTVTRNHSLWRPSRDCRLDGDCALSHHCEGGACVADGLVPCTDGDCGTGYQCSGGACVPAKVCSRNQNCAPGSCVEGVCLPDNACPDGDANCGIDSHCVSTAGGFCVVNSGVVCSSTNPCGVGYTCSAGSCIPAAVCLFTLSCGNKSCIDGACLASNVCTNNSQCGVNQHCVLAKSYCVLNGGAPCTSNAACAANEHCVNSSGHGWCVADATWCPLGGECAGNHTNVNCVGGVCEPVIHDVECKSDEECGGGVPTLASGTCYQGTCLSACYGKADGTSCGGTECAPATCKGGRCALVFRTAGDPCGSAAGECSAGDACDGAGACVPHPKPAGTPCGAAGSACRNADLCDGYGACVNNGYKGPETVCRPAAGICDVAERCDGAHVDCPLDQFQPAAAPCRDAICSDGNGTLAATCTGAGAECPPPVAASCAPYVCGASACKSACDGNDDCVTTHYCDGGGCAPDTPVLALPSDLFVEATGGDGATVDYAVYAATHRGAPIGVSCAPPSGSTFALGTTAVTCDASGRAAGTFAVTVRDTTPPLLMLPATPLVFEATGPSGAVVDFAAGAADLVDGAVGVQCSPAPGSSLPVGVHVVSCAAVDAHGNAAAAAFEVEVRDTTAPLVTVPVAVAATASSAAGAIVSFDATASDLVDGTLTPTCTPAAGAQLPLGTTEVTCGATDAAGNVGLAHFAVTVTFCFGGVLAPVKSDGSSIFKLGSTVPVKFQLCGTSADIGDAAAFLDVAKSTDDILGSFVEATSTAAADAQNRFRYANGQYVFNLATSGLAEGTWNLKIDLGDGAPHFARISLRQ
jgi:hypothetical protein